MPDESAAPLIAEIERDLLDGVHVADILRKLIILGGRAGSSDLRDWAAQELRGYADVLVEDLPSYRKVPAMIQMDAVIGHHQVRHQTVAPHELPEEARAHIANEAPFYQGIGEIQAMAEGVGEGKTVRIALPGERTLAQVMDSASGNPYQHISAIYWSVGVAALEGLVDQVRTRLAELLGELRAVTPVNAEIPTATQATAAVNVVVHGRSNSVRVGHASGEGTSASADGVEASDGPFWTMGRRIGAVAVGVATIASTAIGWWQLQGVA